jgi:hypothetical protein
MFKHSIPSSAPGQILRKLRDQNSSNHPTTVRQAHKPRWNQALGGVAIIVLAIFALGAGSAVAAVVPGPGWRVDSFALPTSFSAKENAACEPGEPETQNRCDRYQVWASNTGSAPTSGPIVLSDVVPAGLTVPRVVLDLVTREKEIVEEVAPCEMTVEEGVTNAHCEYTGVLLPDERLKMVSYVTVNEPEVAGLELTNVGSVTGGGARGASTTEAGQMHQTNRISPSAASFGPSDFDFYKAGSDGSPDTQAADHPYELTATIDLDNKIRKSPEGGNLVATSVEDVKDVVVNLPVGFVASTLAAPECTLAQLAAVNCPADSRIGYLHTEPEAADAVHTPIYNLVPEHGIPAEFGYLDATETSHVFYSHVVPTAKGYVLQSVNTDIPQIKLDKIIATFYGNPADRDAEFKQEQLERESGLPVKREHTVAPAFFTNPTDCAGEEPTATIYMDSWQNPAKVNPGGEPTNLEEPGWVKMESKSPPVTGCNALQFTPELGAQPTTHEADKPSGLEFELKVPQSEESGVLATPTLKKVDVTLPEGFTVDPSAGDGLAACSIAQIGWLGGGPLNFDAAAPECPEASKIGSLELETPLIPHKITGELFLAAQNANPFNSTLAAYVVVNDPITGVLIKIAGEFLPDPHTGRLTALFDENPNLPFSDLKLHFFSGPRAELATPENCGTYTTGTALSPYSLEEGENPASPFDSFVINEACPGGFNPTFTAGSTNLQAGAYTPFEVSFQRQDTDQELQGLSVTLPPGLLADVGSVPLCDEANANAGTCPESSQVGTVQTGVGPGPNPLFVGGKAYLTGPYNNGPYGLSVVVPAVAGPFNFGTVVVRQSIRIDPHTAQVTDVSDPFPTIIDGIPLRLRRVDVVLNRPGFTFNPTSCGKLGFAGTIAGTPLGAPTNLNGTIGYAAQPGASSSFTTPFQVTNCQSLKFQPKFTVTTKGKNSKAGGATLTAKLSYPNLPQGTEANITRVKVDLPKQLPSRLTTLQKACTAKQFETNPANCPKESKIGYATVHTPILPLPLSGPAIFVSHGGEAFPSLTMVLQGDNVTIDLVGTTFISSKGITSTTFKTVPDTPFSTFELTLPQGKFSALAANVPAKAHYSLCGQTLTMPTEFVAQNGAKINESTKVGVTGCAKAHKVKKHKTKSKKKK